MKSLSLIVMLVILSAAGLVRADLIAYWDMDEPAGSTILSDKGNDAFANDASVITSAVNTGVPGKFGNAVEQIANGEQNISAPDGGFPYGQYKDISISLWFKSSDMNSGKVLFSYGGSATGELTALDLNSQGLRVFHYGADMALTPVPGGLAAAEWHHVVYTLDFTAVEQKIYCNGTLITTQGIPNDGGDPAEINITPDSAAPSSVEIGGWERTNKNADAAAFQGFLDDVAVWDSVLTPDEVDELWNEGDGIPANRLGVRGAAHTPTPDGTFLVNSRNALDLTWLPTEDPNALNVTAYDLYFYGISNAAIASDPNLAEPNFVDPVVIPVSLTGNSYTVNAPDLDYEYTYFWRVDSTVQWDSDEITGTLTSVAAGTTWSFETLPANPAPIVVSDGDILTAMEFLDAGISAAVDDEDIDFIEWSIIQHPGTVSDNVGLAWTRNITSQLSHDHDLLGDMILTNNNDATGNPMRLIISGLDAGTYTWQSYHHDSHDLLSQFDVYIDDAAGRSLYPGYTVSLGDENSTDADVTKVIQTIESDGSDVVVIFYLKPSADKKAKFFPINALELAGSAGNLNIDFGPDDSPLKEGYQAYTAIDTDLESFDPVTYDAFGGSANVTVDVEWGLEEAGLLNAAVTDTTVDLSAPTATFSTDLAGTYVIELTATDSAAQTGSDTIEIKVASDACAAAQMAGDWPGFNSYDFDNDCDVDISDFALFAAEWLKNVSLTGQVLQ